MVLQSLRQSVISRCLGHLVLLLLQQPSICRQSRHQPLQLHHRRLLSSSFQRPIPSGSSFSTFIDRNQCAAISDQFQSSHNHRWTKELPRRDSKRRQIEAAPTGGRSSAQPDFFFQVNVTPTSQAKHGSSSECRFEQRRKSFVFEEDLEVFYPTDLTSIRRLERGSQGYVELVSTKFISRVAVKYFDQRVKHWEATASRELCYLIKNVTHPHIVQFHGILFASPSERNKPLGILMEYMDCGSVHNTIYDTTNHYSIIESLNWTRQAASALTFLHKKRLVHRDIKPANMLLRNKGKRLKISDFGLCTTLNTGMTADVVTVVYMAPEVVGRPDGVKYNEKCDVYSLGISLWEMIHRRRPHDGFGFLALMSAVKQGTRPDFDDSICNANVKSLIQKMWALEIADRPRMEEVFEVVYEQLNGAGFFDNLYE